MSRAQPRSKSHPPTLAQIRHRLLTKCLACAFSFADRFMLLLGPALILLACGIMGGLTFVYFRILLPMLAGTNWVYTRGDWGEYWKERGYSVGGASSADADERISTARSTLLALSTPAGVLHTALVLFFLTNIIYNYYKCVVTSNTGPSYDVVVRELASATGFNYPETEEEMGICKAELDRSIFVRLEKRRRDMLHDAAGSANDGAGSANDGANGHQTNTTNGDVESQHSPSSNSAQPANSAPNPSPNNAKIRPPPKIHAWQLLSPHEWSWCRNSKQPKPPRSHYDHVTRSLVLNMDHYCPWMFNVVGYFNYRYFFNFLAWVALALIYGTGICHRPFREGGARSYGERIRAAGRDAGVEARHLRSDPFVPTPEEKALVAFAFAMCLAVGLAVLCLASFHLYLVLSAQTTIEFHGNAGKRRRSGGWANPYCAGSRRRNWEMIYGAGGGRRRGVLGALAAMMPSGREPEFLPLPLDGKPVRRKNGGGAVADEEEDAERGARRRADEPNLEEESDRSASNGTDGLKERAVRRSPQDTEMIV